MPKVRRTQRERVEESTRRLLAAAAELLAEGGYEAATAAAIGRRAGYSREMVRARFGSRDALIEAVVRSTYEGPLTAELPTDATGLQRVLARIDAMHRLAVDDPDLMRAIFTVEFKAVGHGSTVTRTAVARWIARLRDDIHHAIRTGQQDGTIRPDLEAEPTAHAIVAEGVGSAFHWTIDPEEDYPRRISQWRERTHQTLAN